MGRRGEQETGCESKVHAKKKFSGVTISRKKREERTNLASIGGLWVARVARWGWGAIARWGPSHVLLLRGQG